MKRKPPINIDTSSRKDFIMKVEAMYTDRGLPEVCVDSEQIKALHRENQNERATLKDMQKGFELLKQ